MEAHTASLQPITDVVMILVIIIKLVIMFVITIITLNSIMEELITSPTDPRIFGEILLKNAKESLRRISKLQTNLLERC